MVNPSGYTALDLVGFTDRGTYDPNYNYVANDLAHQGGNIWRCLIDDTIGITPEEGTNWTLRRYAAHRVSFCRYVSNLW